ncbi:MAG TPA: DUF1552 domain-containing protein [Rhizomicrobium sp.]|jgi:hypothetical protein
MVIRRRTILRGLLQGSAVTVALPLLDCFLDGHGQAIAATGLRIPTRFGTYFWGCGLTKALYLPKSTGQNYEAMPQLASLEPYRKKINLISGLRAFADNSPNIQHWTGVAAISTGIAPSADKRFESLTIDQTIAGTIGVGTRFKSIEVSCSGNKTESYSSLGGLNANPPEASPISLYTRLFGPGFQDPSKGDWKPDPKVMLEQSALSVVSDERKSMMQSLGAADKARLDQYFTSVRELEQTMAVELQRPEIVASVTVPQAPDEMPVNKSVPVLRSVVPVMVKLVAVGLATDQTRVVNVALAEPASTIFMPGDSKPFHQATHEEPIDPALGYQPVTSKFSTYSMEFFADLVKALDEVKEGDGTLLDHSLILAYTDTGFAKLHTLEDIPMLTAGSASGRIKTGYHIAGAGGPVTRVGLTMQQAMGMSIDSWGIGSMATKKPITEILA